MEKDVNYTRDDVRAILTSFSPMPKPSPGKCHDGKFRPVQELDAFRRKAIARSYADTKSIYDLLGRSPNELRRMPSFGQKTLHEVEEALTKIRLWLGMPLPDLKEGEGQSVGVSLGDA